MNDRRVISGGFEVVAFSGPDAVRFLNGQLTQDVRMVAGGGAAAFSCVTDAKGRLQFRVVITADADDRILVAVARGAGEALEARLTRYLIADDAEGVLLDGAWRIEHFIGSAPPSPEGVLMRGIGRYGVDGYDWWLPPGLEAEPPPGHRLLQGGELEHFRIMQGVPADGVEITAGLLPPEARLEATDISYSKGCYIGQEVISRIRSAGKVNRLLTRFLIDGANAAPGALAAADDRPAGEITSISTHPAPDGGFPALGFLKRGTAESGLHLAGMPVRIAP